MLQLVLVNLRTWVNASSGAWQGQASRGKRSFKASSIFTF